MRFGALTLLFLSLNLSAADNFAIVNFSGHYDAPNGQGTATQFDIPLQEQIMKPVDIRVEAKGEGYLLTTPTGEWDWAEPSAWVKDLKTASWQDISVVVGASSQSAAIGSLSGIHEDKKIEINNFSADCEGSSELIESCLNGTGSVRLSKLVYQSARRSDQFNQILRALVRALDLSGRGDDVVVEKLKLDISNNKFKGEVAINVGISATVKFEGLVSYSKEEGKTAIRLDKAKAIFLDVRGQIFDELEETQSETFIVERPWIYILSE